MEGAAGNLRWKCKKRKKKGEKRFAGVRVELTVFVGNFAKKACRALSTCYVKKKPTGALGIQKGEPKNLLPQVGEPC